MDADRQRQAPALIGPKDQWLDPVPLGGELEDPRLVGQAGVAQDDLGVAGVVQVDSPGQRPGRAREHERLVVRADDDQGTSGVRHGRPLLVEPDAEPARLADGRGGSLRRRRRRPTGLAAAERDPRVGMLLLDHRLLLAREREAPDFRAPEREADVVVVRLLDADVRQLADVQREAQVDDRRLEVDSDVAGRRERVDPEVIVEVEVEVRLERLDVDLVLRLRPQRLREAELEVDVDVVEPEDVDRVRRLDLDRIRHRALLSQSPGSRAKSPYETASVAVKEPSVGGAPRRPERFGRLVVSAKTVCSGAVTLALRAAEPERTDANSRFRFASRRSSVRSRYAPPQEAVITA